MSSASFLTHKFFQCSSVLDFTILWLAKEGLLACLLFLKSFFAVTLFRFTELEKKQGSTMLLSFRLCQLGLRPLDAGGAGDVFFRAVSHKLYGDPSHHWFIRQADILLVLKE